MSLKDIGTPDQEIALLVEEISNRPEFKKIIGQAAEDPDPERGCRFIDDRCHA